MIEGMLIGGGVVGLAFFVVLVVLPWLGRGLDNILSAFSDAENHDPRP